MSRPSTLSDLNRKARRETEQLKQQVDSQQQDLAKLKSELENEKVEKQALQNELKQHKEEKANLERKLQNERQQNLNLSAALSSLQQRYDSEVKSKADLWKLFDRGYGDRMRYTMQVLEDVKAELRSEVAEKKAGTNCFPHSYPCSYSYYLKERKGIAIYPRAFCIPFPCKELQRKLANFESAKPSSSSSSSSSSTSKSSIPPGSFSFQVL